MDGSGKADGTNSTYQWVGEIKNLVGGSLFSRFYYNKTVFVHFFFFWLNCCTYLLPFGIFSLAKLVNRDQPGRHNKVKTDERLRVPRQRDLGKDSKVTKTFVQRRMV